MVLFSNHIVELVEERAGLNKGRQTSLDGGNDHGISLGHAISLNRHKTGDSSGGWHPLQLLFADRLRPTSTCCPLANRTQGSPEPLRLQATPEFGAVATATAPLALKEQIMRVERSPERATHPFVKTDKAVIMGWEQTASGYAAVWATENTREAIFDAMKRRETYATTGPRMVVRFFGGWDFEPADADNRMPAKIGYAKGVPMGGDLSNAPQGKSPTFLVAALKDPIGANLDRLQVIKGWLGKDGQTQERIFDVVVSGDGEGDADGRSKTPVGNTVDVANATWTNTIGAGEMITVWKDPDFDPALRAFYYVRVIEIPTPRWTAYDAKYFGVTMPKDAPMTTTERAYTSPIWYTP